MQKIASTQELAYALQRLLDYASSHRPSRTVLAFGLRDLSLRVAADDEVTQPKETVYSGDWPKAGVIYTQRGLYWIATGERQKNGKYLGWTVDSDRTGPRAEIKPIKHAVDSKHEFSAYKRADTVPKRIWDALKAKL